jgi:hypothetical protein
MGFVWTSFYCFIGYSRRRSYEGKDFLSMNDFAVLLVGDCDCTN